MNILTKIGVALFLIAVIALSTIFVSPFLSVTYSSGYEGPSAAFTSIGIPGSDGSGAYCSSQGSGSYTWINPQDSSTWTWNWQNTGTSFTFKPTDATGNTHTELVGSMTGIGFSNGKATQPTETYSWTVDNPSYTTMSGTTEPATKTIYEMALYPLTYTIEFNTYSSGFLHTFSYEDVPVNIEISLNQNMWYFSSAPSSVYFSVAAMQLSNFTEYAINGGAYESVNSAHGSGLRADTTPGAVDINSLLTISSPTNGESASDAFYNYEGAALNPELFAPDITTQVTINNLSPSTQTNLVGQVTGGSDAVVYLGFTVWTIVIGDWTVKPTYSGTMDIGLKQEQATNTTLIILLAVIAVIIVLMIIYAAKKKKLHIPIPL